MIVAFDNTFLTLVLNPGAPSRANPATGKPVPHCKQRIEALIDTLSKAKGNQVIIPAPALAETLVAADDAEKIVARLRAYTAVEIAPFDGRSAIEHALITKRRLRGATSVTGQTVTGS